MLWKLYDWTRKLPLTLFNMWEKIRRMLDTNAAAFQPICVRSTEILMKPPAALRLPLENRLADKKLIAWCVHQWNTKPALGASGALREIGSAPNWPVGKRTGRKKQKAKRRALAPRFSLSSRPATAIMSEKRREQVHMGIFISPERENGEKYKQSESCMHTLVNERALTGLESWVWHTSGRGSSLTVPSYLALSAGRPAGETP